MLSRVSEKCKLRQLELRGILLRKKGNSKKIILVYASERFCFISFGRRKQRKSKTAEDNLNESEQLTSDVPKETD